MIVREGRPLVGALACLALLLQLVPGGSVAIVGWGAVVAVAWLLRDPRRRVNAHALGLVSPVDGTVVAAGATFDPYRETEAHEVRLRGGWLGPFVLRSPIEGQVVAQWGEWRDPDTGRRSGGAISIRTDEHDEVVLAFSARLSLPRAFRAVIGERVGQGQRFGLLPFGGAARVLFSGHGRLQAQPGQRVLAGVDQVAELLHD